ncbi:hypothetical protein [Azonexus hydrophilus]|uniref:Uncharacterized protein n=1 Tax=Azonexus hydrophilus TaxID=418702 RepID=A0ABZ2XNA2_9RHOO
MNQSECIELRDSIFASQFQTEPKERLFRFLAVEPGGVGDSDATVHFAYAPAVWERAGYGSTPNDVVTLLEATIDETPYKDKNLAVQFHDYLRGGWPIPWGITAKESFNNFPSLVLLEAADGKVTGVLMRDAHCGNVNARIANAYAEPHEVEDMIEELTALAPDEQFMGWYKDCNIAADSIDAAIALTPESDAGQKHVLVYRQMEWLWGLWNNPAKPHAYPMELSSVADFHGTRVSAAKRRSRGELEVAKAKQTIPGDYDVLDQALALLSPDDGGTGTDYEAIPAIKMLCDWWNSHAPEAMRPAACFRVYVWKSNRRTFVAGDPEEPAVQANDLASIPTYAVFEREGRPTVALTFFRGRLFNKEDACGTQTYYANGEDGWQIGVDLDQVDEAYYSLKGLRAIERI